MCMYYKIIQRGGVDFESNLLPNKFKITCVVASNTSLICWKSDKN